MTDGFTHPTPVNESHCGPWEPPRSTCRFLAKDDIADVVVAKRWAKGFILMVLRVKPLLGRWETSELGSLGATT
jgi:hypothetical protein